jgi:hypothetical protein
MHVSYVFLCDSFNVTQDNKLIAQGLFDQVFLKRAPTHEDPGIHRSMIVACGISELEASQNKMVEIRITAPNGDTIESKEIEAKVSDRGRAIIVTGLRDVKFLELGEYRIDVMLDKASQAYTTFTVSAM